MACYADASFHSLFSILKNTILVYLYIVFNLLPSIGFEERFQKEASLCSSAVRPALVKVL